eukprot:CAMPEP_0119042254 /NCGR_PEP_ID=MMETSP1177-20130426/14489_1 /TAXON_ID=2985 /ORGANISM="Ochromonas sp, Strain CCMP1899" /LENGTH=321 /DNA_ID=CAMNT_0007008905 /DNA_START=141 /DNA_END=1106 /DNA_ORIENTATION=-
MSNNEETVLNLETKDLYIDLEKKLSTLYVKISEQIGIQKVRNAVLIPVSGINKLQKVLDDVRLIASNDAKNPKPISNVSVQRKELAKDGEVVGRSIYVSCLTWDTDEDDLVQHFTQAGAVVNAVVFRQRRNAKAKGSFGFGLVEFETRQAAVGSLEMMNGTDLKGSLIAVRADRAPEEEPVTTALEVLDGQTKTVNYLEARLRIEETDISIDLKKNKNGMFFRISESNGGVNNAVFVPTSGIDGLKKVLKDINLANINTGNTESESMNVDEPEVVKSAKKPRKRAPRNKKAPTEESVEVNTKSQQQKKKAKVVNSREVTMS